MAANLKLTLSLPDRPGFRYFPLRIENAGAAPAAVLRNRYPWSRHAYAPSVLDADGAPFGPQKRMGFCGDHLQPTDEVIVDLKPGESLDQAVDLWWWDFRPGRYEIRVTYRLNDRIRVQVEHLREAARLEPGEWSSDPLRIEVPACG